MPDEPMTLVEVGAADIRRAAALILGVVTNDGAMTMAALEDGAECERPIQMMLATARAVIVCAPWLSTPTGVDYLRANAALAADLAARRGDG